jgi:hypothetical protein
MKSKILYIALPALIFIYTSCSKISESLQRDTVITDTVSFEIPVITNIADPVTISNIESPLNFEEQVNAQVQGLSIANLSSVNLRSIDLGLISAESGVDTANTFGKLQSIKLQIGDGIKTDSLARISIASTGPTSTLTLTPVILPETLKPYLSGSSVRYEVIVKAKKVTTKVMKVKIGAVYRVTLSK